MSAFLLLSPKRTICGAMCTVIGPCRWFSFFAARAVAFAIAQHVDGIDDHPEDDEQYYDGGEVHAMTALAIR